MKIGINCGHTVSGTVGSGAVGYLNESDETRAVGRKLIDKLCRFGHKVYDCTDDYSSSVKENLKKICTMANAQQLDMFLSIHFNSGGGIGCEAYTYNGADNAKASCMLEALKSLGFKNRGIKKGNELYVVRNTNAKSCLLEVCFVDSKSDFDLYKKLGAEKIAEKLCESISGVTNDTEGGYSKNMSKTVYSLNDVHMQVIEPCNFKIEVVDSRKKNINKKNYANAGYFATEKDGETIPVGNLVVNGNIITTPANQAEWLSSCYRKQTTLVVHNDNSVEFVNTDDMMTVPTVKYAISGLPIIRDGIKVSMDDIKLEGYSGGELYDTWHGFIGIRDNKLVYVASKVGFDLMVYLMEVLGIKNAIKLDGGGSFILHNNNFNVQTNENRRINNIITWEG